MTLSLETHGKICFMSTPYKYSRNVHNLFLNYCVPMPHVLTAWNKYDKDICWALPNQFLLVNEVKEISFKIAHCPVKSSLVKFRKDIDVTVTFCNMHPETVYHLFWSFFIFHEEIKSYIKTISISSNKKAIKTLDLCSIFQILTCFFAVT